MKTLPDNPLLLDPDFDGACPCSEFTFDGCTFYTHCWRTGCCDFSGVHYFPANDRAKGYASKIANYMTEAWMTEVKVGEAESEIKISKDR